MFSPTPVFFFPYFENEMLDFVHERPCGGVLSFINDLPFLYIHCNLFSPFLILSVFLSLFTVFVAMVESSR